MTPLDRDCRRCLQSSAWPYALSLTATVIKRRVWASALFSGVRLTMVVTANDDDAFDDWLIALPEIDVPLTDHFVADVEVIDRRAKAATIELLVLES